MPDSPAFAVAGVPDLFFSSKITGTASHLGLKVILAGNSEVLLARAAEGAAIVMLDLSATQLDPIGTITRLKSDPATAEIRIVVFANHENAEGMQRARDAGCNEVMTRGAFSSALPSILQSVL
jgi:CheY-like chemotaxis protein